MPMTAAQTLAAAQAHSTVTSANTVVTVNLKFAGREYDPEHVVNALRTQYGATKVSSDRETIAQNSLDLTIIP